MRGIAIVLAVAVTALSLADGWLLKTPYQAKQKLTWKLTVDATMGGQSHQATLKQNLEIVSKDDKTITAKASWTELAVDGSEQPTDGNASWDLTLNPDGSIASVGDGADYARMLAPAAFVYPGKEVKVGDKWTVKIQPDKEAKAMTFDYEVLAEEKVGDADALKIKAKLSEDGPMRGNNTYWIGKDGTLLKFELNLTNWIVPMAGGMDFDAVVKGELIKA